MDSTPEHRALLGLDVVGSADNAGHYLRAVPEAVDRILSTALEDRGIRRDEVMNWENTGDGALLTVPSRHVGRLVDVSKRIDELAAERNRWHKPDVRLRIAIELGPVGDQPGYYAPKISHGRLLDAPSFKALLRRCIEEGPDDSVNTGLILSEHAFDCVFGGDRSESSRSSEFVELPVADKEFAKTAWVRVPGFDRRSIIEFVEALSPASRAAVPDREMRVHNEVRGSMNGIQAGTVHGGIIFGGGRR